MPRTRPLEVKALVALLEEDWATAEQLAEALILRLEELRRDRVDYVNVYQIGSGDPHYLAVGPYPGVDSARRARNGHLSALEAVRYATVALRSDEGFKRHILEVVDKPPTDTGDWAEVKRDAQAFGKGWRGGKSPGRREDYLPDYLGR